jgi:hypothetical protein
LARIFGFSYQGSYYKLPEPTVLLVYGNGQPVPVAAAADPNPAFPGVEFNGTQFAPGVLMWVQDQADYSVRIDITTGWLSDVLLEPGLSDGTNMTTGQGPDSGTRNSASGRGPIVGRAGGHLIGRGNSG